MLDARIKAVLRRASAPAHKAPLDVLGVITVDQAAMRVTRGEEEVQLTPTELRLLLELLQHAGHVLTRRALLERVWDYGYVGDSRLVDACVQRLRAKVEDGPGVPPHRRTAIFVRFVRGDDARTTRDDHSGLGLAIAVENARLHGATVTLSTSGRTAFTLHIPRTQDLTPAR